MAYKSFNKEHIALTKVIENYFGADAYAWDISCLDVARAVIQAGWEKPVLQWIPVTERLPENDQWVLCLKDDGDYWVAAWDYIDWMWSDQNEWYAEKDITHWMPLPEPPKGE